MKEKYKEILIIALFVFLSIFIFRNYFLKGTVPFPANLLVSFYEPWKSYAWEDYPNGPPNKPIGYDNLRIFYPLRKLSVDQLKNFEWPLWNPYNFSGNIHLATYQSAIFHPLSFLFLVLPQIDAWSIMIILQPILCSFFMYLFLKQFSLSRKTSFFGAMVFGFSGFMIVWWEESMMSVYSAMFLPLILYATEKIIKKITWQSFSVLVLGLIFSVFSGWFQTTLYVWALGLIWIIFRTFQKDTKDKRFLVPIFTGYILALIISAIHLLPSLEAFFYSARGTTDAKFIFDDYLLPLQNLITFIAPDFFGNPGTYNYIGGRGFYYEKVFFIGIPALIFAFYELFQFKNSGSKENFFKLVFLITLSLGFSLPTSWFLLYSLKIPLISTVIPSRIFFLSVFSVSVLSAFGMERFLKKPNKKKMCAVLAFFAIVILAGGIYAYLYRLRDPFNGFSMVPLKNMALPSLMFLSFSIFIFLFFRNKRFINYISLGIIALSFFGSAYFSNKYLYFSERRFVYPETPVLSQLKDVSGLDRFWNVGEAYMDRNFSTYYQLFSPEGYDSFYIKRYGELLYSIQNKGKYSGQIPRTDATLSEVKNLGEIFNNPYREKLMSILGVRYIIETFNDGKSETEPNVNFKPVWQDSKFIIYEYKNAFPRVFLVGDYKVKLAPQEILDAMFDNKTDLSQMVILEEKPKDFQTQHEVKGEAKIITYKPNKIQIKTAAENQSILFLSDNYYPDWKAFVDGKETKIYRANYSFRSIIVPKGNHEIVFQYEPQSFRYGMILTFTGLLLFLLINIKIKYRPDNLL